MTAGLCVERWFWASPAVPSLAWLGLGVSDFWSSLGFLFELSLLLNLSSYFQSVKLSL